MRSGESALNPGTVGTIRAVCAMRPALQPDIRPVSAHAARLVDAWNHRPLIERGTLALLRLTAIQPSCRAATGHGRPAYTWRPPTTRRATSTTATTRTARNTALDPVRRLARYPPT